MIIVVILEGKSNTQDADFDIRKFARLSMSGYLVVPSFLFFSRLFHFISLSLSLCLRDFSGSCSLVLMEGKW